MYDCDFSLHELIRAGLLLVHIERCSLKNEMALCCKTTTSITYIFPIDSFAPYDQVTMLNLQLRVPRTKPRRKKYKVYKLLCVLPSVAGGGDSLVQKDGIKSAFIS